MSNKPYGMREIENPFENEIQYPNNQAKNVMVVVKDYKWYKLYKDDIFAISVMAAIIIIVVILSVFSFKVRAQSETISSKDKANADSVMMHSLISIELTVDKLKEELDSVNVHINSVDVHITEGEKEISRAIRELKKNKNRGKK